MRIAAVARPIGGGSTSIAAEPARAQADRQSANRHPVGDEPPHEYGYDASGKPHLTHGQFRNNNLALKQFHRYCEQLGIRTRRIHESRPTFISLARDDGAQRDVIKSLTLPLDDSDAHDS